VFEKYKKIIIVGVVVAVVAVGVIVGRPEKELPDADETLITETEIDHGKPIEEEETLHTYEGAFRLMLMH